MIPRCPADSRESRSTRGLTNFSGETVMELRVNLKVCEGCGCLWYRAQVETRVYCTSCHERFKDFPTAQTRKRRGRPKKTILPTVFAVEAPANFSWASQNRSTYGLHPAEYGHQARGYGRQAEGYGLQAEAYGLQAGGYGLQAGGYGLQPVHHLSPHTGALAPEGMPLHLPVNSATFAGGAQ
jgi:hypothetical protein